MSSQNTHHKIVIVGGGSAGISVASRLLQAGEQDVAVIDRADAHYCQPLWTLVGGGVAPAGESARAEAAMMPHGATWIKDAATGIDPDGQSIQLASGSSVGYDFLVVCPGLALDWGRLPGSAGALGRDGVSSNYQFDLAPKTWEFIEAMRSGTAVFTMPAGPIKCAGAPQKIAYLAADWWLKQGVLKDIHVVLVLPTPKMFGVPEFSSVLEEVAARYGMDVRLQHKAVEVNPAAKERCWSTGRAAVRKSPRCRMTWPTWCRRKAHRTGSRPARWPTRPTRVAMCRSTRPPCSTPATRTLQPGRRRVLTQLQDRRRDQETGPRRGQEPARGHGRPRAHGSPMTGTRRAR